MLTVTEGVAYASLGLTGAKTSANSTGAVGASKEPIMAHAQTQLGQDTQYEPFLYAAMGEDRRGTSVTVLSMLARLGVNPWGEASDLADLPEGAAQHRLEALMARFNDVQTNGPGRSLTVSKLLAFLPQRAGTPRPALNGASARLTVPTQRSPVYWIVAAALVLAWVAMLTPSP
jgi:hypothetical protein